MSVTEAPGAEGQFSERARVLGGMAADALSRGELDGIPNAAVQQLMTAAVKLYVAKREAGSDLSPFEPGVVTATEVAVTATSMLKAVQLEVFELTLWTAWGRIESSTGQ